MNPNKDVMKQHPVIAGTGHRPNKLGGYSDTSFERLVSLADSVLVQQQPSRVISGMALGWDQALAVAAVRLGIPWTAAIPFVGQERAWPPQSQAAYRELLARATDVVVVCEGGYHRSKMQIRNRWMVNHADLVLALWNGTAGGTANCVEYAEQQGTPILNVWDRFAALLPAT